MTVTQRGNKDRAAKTLWIFWCFFDVTEQYSSIYLFRKFPQIHIITIVANIPGYDESFHFIK